MAFTGYGFIYLGSGQEDPAIDRATIERGGLRTTLVAVANLDQAPAVAAELVADGAQSIELCGAFTAAHVAAVRDALDPAIPVGAVHFDMQAAPLVTALFA